MAQLLQHTSLQTGSPEVSPNVTPAQGAQVVTWWQADYIGPSILGEEQGAVLTEMEESSRSQTASPAHAASANITACGLNILLHHHRIPEKSASHQTGDVPLVRHPPLGGARETGLGR